MLLAGSRLSVPAAAAETAIGFGKSLLALASPQNPTSLQFGPDGRLYVAQADGTILAYSIKRNGANDYSVTATETITKIRSIPNHNDDGTPAPDAAEGRAWDEPPSRFVPKPAAHSVRRAAEAAVVERIPARQRTWSS